MVVAGGYSAQLVNAETRCPFQEHVGDKGEVYAEIEPDCEYFIQFQMLDDDSDTKRKICVQVAVDGTLMDSRTILNKKSGKVDIGVLSRENGKTISTAFALRNPTVKYNSDAKLQSCMPIGSVVIRISEAVKVRGTESMDFMEEGLAKDMDAAVEVPYEYGLFEAKKFLRSAKGTTLLKKERNIVTPERASKYQRLRQSRNNTTYIAGSLLQEINIHYCTALGLIHAGVLDKPPMWDLFRKKQHYGKRINTQSPRPKPTKRIRIDAVYDGDVLVTPAKTIEVFDLTTTLSVEVDGEKDENCDGPGFTKCAEQAVGSGDSGLTMETNARQQEEVTAAARTAAKVAATLDPLAHMCSGGSASGLQKF